MNDAILVSTRKGLFGWRPGTEAGTSSRSISATTSRSR
jgi:hypothetical protein